MLAATPLGVTPMDTGEFLLGTVGVTVVLFESNGEIDPQTQNWTPEEIDGVLAKVSDGVQWWSDMLDTLGTVHTLDFVIDDTFAKNPVETGWEPIDNDSGHFNHYVGDFVTAQGFGDATSIEDAIRRFNHAQRMELGTDWAFTIFVVDSSDDPNGLFASGGTFAAAFAFAGGLFFISPSTRPVSTFTHELGHIFWARDEYPGGGSWTDQRGYYNTQNLNAADNPTPGFQQEISIMRGGVPLNAAFEAFVSPATTLAFVGWQDSDGDGVFDLADVPLDLDAVGYFDVDTSLYHFSGSASAVPLMNRNSSGAQSDITLNRISQLQFRLDDGDWQVAAEPDQQVALFDFSMAISQPFSTIHWRVIDLATGITSAEISGSVTEPALTSSSVSGLAFVDANGNRRRDVGEATLENTQITVLNVDGSELFGGQVDATEFADGAISGTVNATLSADGVVSDPEVGSFVAEIDPDQRVFHSFDNQRNRWIHRWSSKVALEANFDGPVGQVEIDAIGLDEIGFARLEGYDASGTLIGRVTSDELGAGETVSVKLTDSEGRIVSIRAFGHAGTSVALNNLRFGSKASVVTDASGAWRLENLPEGEYQVDLAAELLIHQYDAPSITVEVASGTSERIDAAATRVDSPYYNAAVPEDANQDDVVTSGDALVIINDLSRFGTRILTANETTTFDVDVNNDGTVSAIDALLVINRLGRDAAGEGEAVGQQDVGINPPGSNSTQWSEQGTEHASATFDFAGGSAADTSAEQSDADTNHRVRGTAQLQNSSVIRDFALLSQTLTAAEREQNEKNAEDLDHLIDLIRPEISEPFARSEI